MKGRLLLVSNRLPITLSRKTDGTFDFTVSSGGLASGLAGMAKTTKFHWYGWPGMEIPEDERPALKKRLMDEHDAVPVNLDEELADRHYNGFSNSILWPLFHYHPSEITFDESAWSGYQEANRIFAKVIAADVQDGDIIWVHDYHLMLLPAMLREELGESKKNIKIGFFLHTPFPSSEIYRILPVRNEILEGVLCCDLIGFHTYDYARHFLSSCSRILALPTTPNSVTFQNRTITIGAFPIGIDPDKFSEGLKDPEVQSRMAALSQKFAGVKVIVGVDRLDYIKGVPQKLHALEVFLTEHPEWIGKLVLVQVAIPSRGDVEDYQNLRACVNELVGRINGKFGTIEFTPIHFLHKSLSFPELLALYSIADICLISSTRDGMNLVAYEYIATQTLRDQFPPSAAEPDATPPPTPMTTKNAYLVINNTSPIDAGKPPPFITPDSPDLNDFTVFRPPFNPHNAYNTPPISPVEPPSRSDLLTPPPTTIQPTFPTTPKPNTPSNLRKSLNLNLNTSLSPTKKIHRHGGHGVLILSEFAGAAQSLNGSLIVNPWNTEELAEALFRAATMGDEERAMLHGRLRAYVERFTSAWWGRSFVEVLEGY
ncbi:glycosyl transferase [Tothia fuscella]|uniref:Glycosyl transferase n=1 Tax=Tothia fuscella TaxID=1048955 RepID=A0A9P4NGY8_9PEZI|nr:glycosyl transferase [Tothia fuscella]